MSRYTPLDAEREDQRFFPGWWGNAKSWQRNLVKTAAISWGVASFVAVFSLFFAVVADSSWNPLRVMILVWGIVFLTIALFGLLITGMAESDF